MEKNRKIKKLIKSKATIEGAGVHLKRAFGFGEVHDFDPFLLFDDFRSDNPAYFIKGFPWHPHRGIETITYVLNGKVEHADSMGNKGEIDSGDVQWMTAAVMELYIRKCQKEIQKEGWEAYSFGLIYLLHIK